MMKFETARLIQLQALDNEVQTTDETRTPVEADRRGKIIEAMPPEIVSRYERLKTRYARPVVRLVGGVCEGCRVRMAASIVQQLRTNGSMQTCDHCGRFIFFDGD